jgi:hypothetical protein
MQEMPTLPFFIEPDLRRDRITATLIPSAGTSCTLTFQENDYAITSDQPSCQIPIEAYEPWTPDTPNLIDLKWDSPGESTGSSVSIGMREFTIKDTRFYLNHRPIHARAFGIEQTNFNSETSVIREQLQQIKQAGFNTVLLEETPNLTRWTNICDELGLLVWAQLGASVSPFHLSNPSVVLMHTDTENHQEIDGWKQLNPDKIIEFVEAGQIKHIRPYKKQTFDGYPIDVQLQTPINGVSTQYLQNVGDPDTINWLQLASLNPVQAPSESQKAHPFIPDYFEDEDSWNNSLLEFFSTQTQLAIDAVRTNEKLAGYSLVANIPDENMEELQAPIRPLIFLQRINLVPRAETKVNIILANTLKLEGRADLSLQVIGPTNQVLWKKKRGIKIPKHGKTLWEGSISASGSTGVHTFVVRIIQNMKQIAESRLTFYVYPEATPWEKTINILDPTKKWAPILTPWASDLNWHSLIHIIPPLANTIRSYPDNEFAQILGSVYQGASVLIFSPPSDWNELAQIIEPELTATQIRTTQSTQVPYARLHPVFENTPARNWMGHTFANLIPTYGFREASDEPISEIVSLDPDTPSPPLSLIHVKRYGSGRVVFVGLKILDSIQEDPVAQHLFVNLLKHVARRSHAAEGSLPVHQKAVEWLRHERMNHTRLWSLVGPFPDSNGTGMENTFPPEDHVDLQGTYPGWYKAVQWTHWFANHKNKYRVNLNESIGKVNQNDQAEPGITYAYTEFTAERRGTIRLTYMTNCSIRIWLNQSIVVDSITSNSESNEQEISVKQGRNTLLLKIRHKDNRSEFGVDLEPIRENVPIKWGWKQDFSSISKQNG